MAGAVHGKKSRLAVGGYDLSCISNSAGQSLTKDMAPADTFCLDDHSFEAGQKGGSFRAGGVRKASSLAMGALLAEIVERVDTTVPVAYAPQGYSVGNPVLLSTTHQAETSVAGDNKSVVNWSASFEADGGVALATILVSPYV